MTAQYQPANEPDALWQAAAALEDIVAELCARLRPFPAFLGMTTIQAIELDPSPAPLLDWGAWLLPPMALSPNWT